MTAALAFDDSFSAIVQGSYPARLPTKAKEGTPAFLLAQKTHQFRYYLDKKNNDALRATYPNYANDLERLKAYNAEHSDNALTGEKARYRFQMLRQAFKLYYLNFVFCQSKIPFSSTSFLFLAYEF